MLGNPAVRLQTEGKKITLAQGLNGRRGVTATQPIRAGECVERCPLLFLKKEEVAALDGISALRSCLFVLEKTGRGAFAMGYGTFYFASESPNAEIRYTQTDDYLEVVARCDISPGTEITRTFGQSI